MNLSFWELNTWFSNVDFTIIGSGIVGLSCALSLREEFPNAKILVLERGSLPAGASTKNAGFASFGSLSEIISDLEKHSQEQIIALVQKRVDGLQMLRNRLGDEVLDYKEFGGTEIFLKEEINLLEKCKDTIQTVNKLLFPIFNEDIFSVEKDKYEFRNIHKEVIFNKFEGQIDTGRMMAALLKKSISNDILILTNTEVTGISDSGSGVNLQLNNSWEFKVKKVGVATNGFAKRLIPVDVKPARAQVLITKPIKNLRIKGTFHFDEGYYYFRNYQNRVLFGGARNLDFKEEETTVMAVTEKIQSKLQTLLQSVILPDISFETEHRWSGIMGMGDFKYPIVEGVSDNISCAVRLSGIGIAIGSLVGEELAELIAST